MKNRFQISIQLADCFGTLTYLEDEKKVDLFFPLPEQVQKLESFFSQPVTIREMVSLREYRHIQINPLESLKNFKAALSELHNQTGLRVDWSVYNEKIPRNERP